MKILYVVLIALVFSSCDIDFGEEGVVVDSQTGLRVEGVMVKMKNHHKDNEDVTDSVGYFKVFGTQNCGFNCDDSYTITFTKPGYDTLTIGDTYYRSAEYVSGTYKDTLIVKMQPLP